MCIGITVFIALTRYYCVDARSVSASGTATGVDTPVAEGEGGLLSVGGGKQLSRAQFYDAKRYFGLFQEALSARYRHLGYHLTYNKNTGTCLVSGPVYKPAVLFEFEPAAIKNHYCTFRLCGEDIDEYFKEAQSITIPNEDW